MKLIRLPHRIDDAPTNMAIDSWMLSMLDQTQVILFRSYGWVNPAFTFGYTQKIAEVIPRFSSNPIEFCRRPSGGGAVDHRADWTYALAVYSGSSLGRIPPLDLYKQIHTALSESFTEEGVTSELFIPQDSRGEPVACFDRPSPFDVVLAGGTHKIAGAALKRTKKGVLLQGSVDRALLKGMDWQALEDRFIQKLSSLGNPEPVIVDMDFPENSTFLKTFISFKQREWNFRR